jgi:hypothetical protein
MDIRAGILKQLVLIWAKITIKKLGNISLIVALQVNAHMIFR